MELFHLLLTSLVISSCVRHSDGDDFLVTVLERLASLSERIHEAGKQIEKLKPEELKVGLGVLKTKVDCIQDDVPDANTYVGVSVNKMKADLAKIKATYSAPEPTENAGTATFVRWGRSSCPNGNELVYTGFGGGAIDWDGASASNILCLPDTPIYAKFSSDLNESRAEIYGLVARTALSSRSKGPDLRCVVCANQRKVSSIMVPARNQCHEGWDLEYWGYLYGGGRSTTPTGPICVDARIEGVEQDLRNKKYIMRQATICGSLSCPPYRRIGPIMCAVCTQ